VPAANGRREISASDRSGQRQIRIRVSSRTDGDWQSSYTSGAEDPDIDPHRFWVFVDLKSSAPDYYMMLESEAQRLIFDGHAAYLAQHGICNGERAEGGNSTHTKITTKRVAAVTALGQWHRLGILRD